MERKLSEMEEELKVSSQITLSSLRICYVYESEWKKCSHTSNSTMRRLDAIVCDFICTNIRISIFTILDFCFLVSYTPSSLFSCVAVSQRQAKTAIIIFGTKTRSLRLRFSLPGNFTQIDALLSFLFSIFDRFRFLFVTGNNNFQQLVLYFP